MTMSVSLANMIPSAVLGLEEIGFDQPWRSNSYMVAPCWRANSTNSNM